MLKELVERVNGYALAKQRSLARLGAGYELGTRGEISWGRDELHEREVVNPYGLTYGIGMANVVTTGEARDALHKIAQRFDDGESEPVYFGSHRRAQAVIVPVDVWERLLEHAEDEVDIELARDRLARDDGRRLSRAEIDDVFDRLRAGRSP